MLKGQLVMTRPMASRCCRGRYEKQHGRTVWFGVSRRRKKKEAEVARERERELSKMQKEALTDDNENVAHLRPRLGGRRALCSHGDSRLGTWATMADGVCVC